MISLVPGINILSSQKIELYISVGCCRFLLKLVAILLEKVHGEQSVLREEITFAINSILDVESFENTRRRSYSARQDATLIRCLQVIFLTVLCNDS